MTQCKNGDYWSLENRYERLLARCTPIEIAAMSEDSANPRYLRTCNMCNMLFDTVRKLHKHVETEEHQKVRCKILGLEYVPPKLPHCDVCDKDFLTKANLEKHYRTKGHRVKANPQKKVTVLKCECCKKKFKGSNLKFRFKQHKKSRLHKLNAKINKLRMEI